MDMRVGEVGSGDEGYVRGDEDERNESLIFVIVCDVGVVWFEMHVNVYAYVANEVSRVRLVMARRRWIYKPLVFLTVSLSSLSYLLFVSKIKNGKGHGSWRLCGDFSKNVRLQRHMSLCTTFSNGSACPKFETNPSMCFLRVLGMVPTLSRRQQQKRMRLDGFRAAISKKRGEVEMV
jgi:hypothetical protein